MNTKKNKIKYSIFLITALAILAILFINTYKKDNQPEAEDIVLVNQEELEEKVSPRQKAINEFLEDPDSALKGYSDGEDYYLVLFLDSDGVHASNYDTTHNYPDKVMFLRSNAGGDTL